MIDPNSLGGALLVFISGSTFVGIVAHAVNTFPMPKSAIGRWFLGVVQYTVGQRLQGQYTMNGGGTLRAAADTARSEQLQRQVNKLCPILKEEKSEKLGP